MAWLCMGLALEADNLRRCPARGIALPSGGEVTVAPGNRRIVTRIGRPTQLGTGQPIRRQACVHGRKRVADLGLSVGDTGFEPVIFPCQSVISGTQRELRDVVRRYRYSVGL
jgi:hypothetical protein